MKSAGPLSAVFALGIAAVSPAKAAGWEFEVMPNLWGSGINGTQGVGGRNVEVDASFSDIVGFIDMGFALRAEGRGPTWGWYGDYFYNKLSDKKNLPRLTLKGETRQTIAEAGASYRFNDVLEGMAGLLYQKNEMKFTVEGLGSLDASESWVDGLVGLRWQPVATDKWNLWLRGGIGAGDSDLVWLGSIGAEYRFTENWSAVLAYRYLDTDYESGTFKWDIVQQGLGLGVGYSW